MFVGIVHMDMCVCRNACRLYGKNRVFLKQKDTKVKCIIVMKDKNSRNALLVWNFCQGLLSLKAETHFI